jgi:hypothetical protein
LEAATKRSNERSNETSNETSNRSSTRSRMENHVMTVEQPPVPRQGTSKLLRIGQTFIGAAAIIGMTGVTLMAAAAAAAARRQYSDAHLPPTEFAKRHWQSAKSAVTAGRGAWYAVFASDAPEQPGNGTRGGTRNGTRAGAHTASHKHAATAS